MPLRGIARFTGEVSVLVLGSMNYSLSFYRCLLFLHYMFESFLLLFPLVEDFVFFSAVWKKTFGSILK